MDASPPSTSNLFSSPVMSDSPAKPIPSSPGIKQEVTVGNCIATTSVVNNSNVGTSSAGSHNARSPGAATTAPSTPNSKKVLDKRRLNDLAKEVDPLLQMDDDVEELMMQIADDFIDNVVTASCDLAKLRKSNTLECKDLTLVLERNYNMWIPGLGNEDLRPYKKPHVTEAHRQRMNLIKKSAKKY